MSDQDPTRDRPGRVTRLIRAAAARLEGRWDDPTAWRVLCEELAGLWHDQRAVRWAMVVPRPDVMPADLDTGPDGVVLWQRQGPPWHWRRAGDLAGFWQRLAAGAGRLAGALDAAPASLGLVPPDDAVATGWLAHGMGGGRQPALAVVLGLDRPAGDDPGGDPLTADLEAVATWLAPVLGQQRRLTDLRGEVSALRQECETLSRLGDLRARLAAVTAHELKTPLTSITAYAEVLEQQLDDPGFDHAGEFLQVIRGESDRLVRLVDRLLDSSRRGRGQTLGDLQPLAVGALTDGVARTLAPQATARDLRLTTRVPAGLPPVAGDADLLRQVLVNLLGNALKFTPAGGQVVLAAREDAAMVRLEVADSGPGIPPEELRAIFQSFYRARNRPEAEGVGLGLSIVKEIVALHDGSLDVHSRPGRGTTFGVLLPKAQVHAEAATALTSQGCDPALQRRLAGLTLRLVAELAGARAVAILLPDDHDRGDHLVAAALGLPGATAGARVAARSLPASGRPTGATQVRDAPLLGAVGEPAPRPGDAMLAPLPPSADGTGPATGWLLVTRRLGGGAFGEDDLLLLGLLTDIVGQAWHQILATDTDRHRRDRMLEALTTLSGLRRTGVPTADPLALRLLSRTGRRLGLSPFEIRLLQYAGALHDAGMVLVDPDVVLKPTPLDLDERDHIDRHPQRGLDLLGPLVALPQLREIIRHHHERVDGSGYPEGRRGEDIPLGARILAVVDAFFAMIHSRPWREGRPVAEAVAELQRHTGSQFDPRVVEAFLAVLLEEGLLPEPTIPPVGGGPRR
jgi:signal transduction histidine kinase